jgi:hypothetical protein
LPSISDPFVSPLKGPEGTASLMNGKLEEIGTLRRVDQRIIWPVYLVSERKSSYPVLQDIEFRLPRGYA